MHDFGGTPAWSERPRSDAVCSLRRRDAMQRWFACSPLLAAVIAISCGVGHDSSDRVSREERTSTVSQALSGSSSSSTLAAGSLHTCALLNSGGVQCWGDNTYGELGNGGNPGVTQQTPVDVSALSGVTAIA